MTLPFAKRTLAVVAILGLSWPGFAQDEPEPAPTQPPPKQAPAAAEPKHPLDLLLDEIDALNAKLEALRRELAQARMDAARAQREFEELRQFIADHHEYGEDFEQYTEIKEIALREARRRKAEATRRSREAERADRLARRQAARAERDQQDAEARRLARYRKAGFSSLGLGVYASKMAYYYRTKDTTQYDIEFDPFFGLYHVDRDRISEIDYSSMTISGSVLNAADEVRNIGVAITFFDDKGNQVGGEIVQINNARPDVPYPFTSTLQMALNRPFNTFSTYVLYADAVGSEPPPPPTTKPSQPYTPTNGTP